MNDNEWVQKELARYRKEEIEAVKRLARAREAVSRAEEGLAAAKEWLEGTRGGIKEFEYQIDYLNEYGRLP